jgi:hypothetical protein
MARLHVSRVKGSEERSLIFSKAKAPQPDRDVHNDVPLLRVGAHHDPCRVGRLSIREVVIKTAGTRGHSRRPCLNPAATQEEGAV